MMQQKFLKRTVDELDVASTPGAEAFEPGAKNDGASPAEKRTRFSVEIIQQLEFTTSGAAPQTQQISTNVTVKTVKSDAAPSSPKAAPPDLGALVECKVEQPEDSEFVDLEQCAAALEKDAAANGGATVFPGLSDLIGDESGDEIITSDALKHLISEISDDICDFPPDFMKDFDFDGDAPDDKSGVLSAAGAPPPQAKAAGGGGRYGASGYPLSSVDVSTAAQALKHMAEQHQHKSQMGFVGRPPYPPDLDLGPATDYLGGGGGYATSKPPADKPEPAGAGMYAPPPQQPQQQQPPPPQGGGGYAQSAKATPPQYAPYGPGTGGGPQFRPQAAGAGLSMSQAQQLTLQQSGGGAPQIQVSVGQHMQLSDMKPYFGQQATDASGVQYSVSQSQTINFTQQSLQQRARPMMHPQPPRAPPPEYKAAPNMQQRFAMRRPHQPMPPSGPMMRAQMLGGGGMYLPPQPHRVSGYVTPCQQRPPNVSIAPDGGMNLAGRQGDWRQLLVSQQQSALFRPGFQQQPQGSFTMAQLQQMAVSRGPVMQQQMPQGPGQMSVNLQMSQSMSLSSHHMPLYGNNSVNSQPPDLSLEFLELPPTSDSGHFSAQELLNSLDTSSSTFNLQDML